MDYQQSLNYLNSFDNLERIDWSKKNRSLNLDRMRFLLKLFDHPEKDLFSVIIAGTKGKGSTGFFLESILKESKIRTGFYTSPHLETPRERIRINGKRVSEKKWAEVFTQIKKKLSLRHCEETGGRRGNLKKRDCFALFSMTSDEFNKSIRGVTYFEMMTLAAALVFKKNKTQVAIWEVGMGGRLDATNVMGAKLGMITPIHLDHMAILGNTIAKIAAEKAAVIQKKMPVVVMKQTAEAARVIERVISHEKASLFPPLFVPKSCLGLEGSFQSQNAGAALRASEILKTQFRFKISKKDQKRGLRNKSWPGRYERVCRHPEVILDVAHNPAAMKAFVENVKASSKTRPKTVIFGTSRDKDAEGMLEILSKAFETIFLVQAEHPRSVEVKALMEKAQSIFNQVIPVPEGVSPAIEIARNFVGKKGQVFVTGSFYVVGEARKGFGGRE